MTDEVQGQVLTPEQAERRAKAEDRAERIVTRLESAAEDYAAAIIEEDWRALGLSGLDEWRARVFGDKRLTVEARRQLHEALNGHGMGQREIAGATGVHESTVSRDLASSHSPQSVDDTGLQSASPALTRPDRHEPSRPKTPAERQADHRQRQREARTTPVATKTRPPVTGAEWDEFNKELAELAVSRQDQELAAENEQLKKKLTLRGEYITQLKDENEQLKERVAELEAENAVLRARPRMQFDASADPFASLPGD